MKTLFHRSEPVIIAHRGSRLLWPENTMTAFEKAAGFGAKFIETDLRVSADGILHCFHDAFLDRTTDGSGPIGSQSSRDLQLLDAGYHHRIGNEYPFRGQGVGVPTFASVLEAFGDFGFVVDIKNDGAVEPLAEMIKERDLAPRLIAGSFSTHRLLLLREICGRELATSTGPAETVRAILAGRLGASVEPFGPTTVALQVPVSWYGVPVVTNQLIDVAHRAGKLVHVWTINEVEEMRRLFELGVDGVITDRIDLVPVM
ncbi:MAG TPA: glycerophosphodiester phosphodiesterase [Acidimicrobiia bacterium]|nr:glycerophosphodiester phosphodiesterase [Acidimicrobiia bacterium]